jgi:hypothetical protein
MVAFHFLMFIFEVQLPEALIEILQSQAQTNSNFKPPNRNLNGKRTISIILSNLDTNFRLFSILNLF